MNMTLFAKTFKRSYVQLIIFISVICMYGVVMITMYKPEDIKSLTDMLNLFPPEVLKVLGFDQAITSLITFLASWLYGLLMYGFPLVYCILLGNGLVAKMVDNGSFAYLLSTPSSRTKIIVTQWVYAMCSLIIMFAVAFGVNTLVSEMMLPGELDIGRFFALNAMSLLVNMAAMAITFFCSCLFSDAKTSSGVATGVTVGFLLMKMLGGYGGDIAFLKNVSLYGLYDPVKFANGESAFFAAAIYVAIIVVLFFAGLLIFRKKQLPL